MLKDSFELTMIFQCLSERHFDQGLELHKSLRNLLLALRSQTVNSGCLLRAQEAHDFKGTDGPNHDNDTNCRGLLSA